MEKKKTLTQRVSDVEFLLGRLVTKLDRYEPESDIFGNPGRAGMPWTAKEKNSFAKVFKIFIETRAEYHKRSIEAMMAFIDHNRHQILRSNALDQLIDETDEA